MNSLTLLHQLLDLEVFSISPGEHPDQLALAPTGLTIEIIEALHRADQPSRLRRRDTTVRNNLTVHQYQALVIRQIQIVRYSRMGLRERAMHLIGIDVGENDRRGVIIRRLARGRRRALGRRVECPLQEVDIRHSLVLGVRGLLLGGLAFPSLTREREDELRVVSCGVGDALVGF